MLRMSYRTVTDARRHRAFLLRSPASSALCLGTREVPAMLPWRPSYRRWGRALLPTAPRAAPALHSVGGGGGWCRDFTWGFPAGSEWGPVLGARGPHLFPRPGRTHRPPHTHPPKWAS